jgi:hypothetical protein
MKNKYNFSQVAACYCAEIGVEIPCMEQYLRAIFNNGPVEEYEKEIIETIKGQYDGRSEFFPEYKQ